MLCITNRNQVVGPNGSVGFGNEETSNLSIVQSQKVDKIWTNTITSEKNIDLISISNGKPLVLFVHGFNNSFDDALDTCQYISAKYDVSVMGYSWPSDGRLTDYFDDREKSIESSAIFGKCLDLLRGKLENTQVKISAIFHSMGNHLFKHFLQKNRSNYERCNFLYRVGLISADVKKSDTWCKNLSVVDKVYVFVNERDYALAASSSLHEDLRLGNAHPSNSNVASNIVSIDFTAVVGDTHNPFYATDEKVIKVLGDLLTGNNAEEGLVAIDGVANAYEVVAHNAYCSLL